MVCTSKGKKKNIVTDDTAPECCHFWRLLSDLNWFDLICFVAVIIGVQETERAVRDELYVYVCNGGGGVLCQGERKGT